MGVEAIHNLGMEHKDHALLKVLEQKKLKAENVIYIGNDLNDLSCFKIAGWSVAVADAAPEVLRAADHVLTKSGGHGAVRELCELVLKNM
jgi:N-acylneuraminate cytidylyltransferase